jgi:hypothetical protein
MLLNELLGDAVQRLGSELLQQCGVGRVLECGRHVVVDVGVVERRGGCESKVEGSERGSGKQESRRKRRHFCFGKKP